MSDATVRARLERSVTKRAGYQITTSYRTLKDGREVKRESFKRLPERVSARSIAAEAWDVATRVREERGPYRPNRAARVAAAKARKSMHTVPMHKVADYFRAYYIGPAPVKGAVRVAGE